MATASIVIPVRDQAALTKQCLDAGLVGGSAEIVVVDDCSLDETPEMLRDFGDRIRVLTHDDSHGFATSCNEGAAATSGEYLVFLKEQRHDQRKRLARSRWSATRRRYRRPPLSEQALLYQNGTVQHAGIVICYDRVPRHVYRFFAGNPAVNRAAVSGRHQAACSSAEQRVPECRWLRRGVRTATRMSTSASASGRRATKSITALTAGSSTSKPLPGQPRLPAGLRTNRELYLSRWGHLADDFATYFEDGLVRIQYTGRLPRSRSGSRRPAVVHGR